MERGLYEQLVTQTLLRQLTAVADLITITPVDAGNQPHVLARYVESAVQRALAATSDPRRRLELVNSVLRTLADDDDTVSEPARQLQAVLPAPGPGVDAYADVRPATPLSEAALLTNTRGEPNFGSEIKAELGTADEVDLLCAFVKWYGLRLLEPELRRLRARNAPFRVITTTYIGATDPNALDRLVRDFGAEVKISYDSERTRLHAKAWMFRRATTFDTAYVGSSNLSRAALLDGVEWNVRLSRTGTPSLLDKFRATFDTYWNDPSFELYDPQQDRDRLDDALAEASGRRTHERVTLSLSGLEVRPFAYQQTMLDALDVERLVHDHHDNLVVAATGTGKTVVAALDFRRLGSGVGERPSLLFVAHRREILEQSLRTYREVLSDADFGELYVGGARPERWRHVFASVQSLTAYGVDRIDPSAYDIVVIDEFHHAEAATYRRLLNHLEPRELLGLTATPERTDGLDVRSFFGGRTAAELRLWDALGADLLCPFHYFAMADGTDLRQVGWTRGRYDDAELSSVYTGNRARAAIVLSQLRDLVLDLGAMRALGFCVSVAHAEFMAQVFRDAGIAALAVSGVTPAHERAQALQDLRARRLNVLFAADLFNEGLDLPDVDTLLFLRPTESATLFLQQLGRGLRRTRDKAVLTVLDFVGHHRTEFRFDRRLRALTGASRRGLERDIERGFPFLPSGCQIVMDQQSQHLVLENIRSQVGNRWPQVVSELRSVGDQDLATFIAESGVELADIIRSGRSWTRLRRDAGLATRAGSNREAEVLKRIRAFAHVDDETRRSAYSKLLADDAPAYNDLTAVEQRVARMLFFQLWPGGGEHGSIEAGFEALRRESAVRDELTAVIDLAFSAASHVPVRLSEPLRHVPLQIHGRYQREEVLAALDYASLKRKPNSFREGVLYVPDIDVDAFFVTLQKSEADFSPTTLYRDYPISPTLFHWESQSTTSVGSATGQRYLHGSSTKLIFVRQHKSNEYGTSPYLFAGPATYVQHSGERPIAITWRLEQPLPNDLFAAASLAAS
jgi:superfamily II DNA or RNA helicase/HKD family nuclease